MPQIDDSNVDAGTWDSTSGSGSGGGAPSDSNSSGALLSSTQGQEAGGAIGAFGTAIGDFMSIGADNEAASAYQQAANIAGENVNITETAALIQQSQLSRKLAMTYGQQGAATAANGFAPGTGSGMDIYKSSVEQGALASSLITDQATVTENAYRAQQTSDLSMEAQAKAKAAGAMVGGIASSLQGVLDVAQMAAA